MTPRTGRPKTSNPKMYEIKARVDEQTNNEINDYCKQNRITRTQAVRKGIELVLGKKK